MKDSPQNTFPAFPIVVSGPSGVGKTVLCQALLERLSWTERSVSATTRPPRGEEVDGDSYFFRTEDQFRRDIAAGQMAEWAEVHGRLYGTPKDFLDSRLAMGKCVLLNIDVQGGVSMKESYPDSLLIFVLPPSWTVLERRLRQRKTDSEEQVAVRLERARGEVAESRFYDHFVINDDLEDAVARMERIAIDERTTRERSEEAGLGRRREQV